MDRIYKNIFTFIYSRIIMKGAAVFLVLISASVFTLYPQPRMELSTRSFNFGSVSEEDGIRTCTFTFTNSGNRPLVIQNIVPSCGCTVPEWTKTPVAPGGKGSITAVFDPEGMAGVFSKTLSVHANSTPSVIVLTIKGMVIARKKTAEEQYSWPAGIVRFESRELAFPGIARGQKRVRVMPVLNTSAEPARIEFLSVPQHLALRTVPAVIRPGQRGLVECTYYSDRDERWGKVSNTVKIKVNNTEQKEVLTISATLVEDFSALSQKELADAPVFKPVANRIDLGTMGPAESRKGSFMIRNEGRSDLIIRSIAFSCDCLATVDDSDLLIKAGMTGRINIVFSSEGLGGSITRSLNVISNDPRNPYAILLVHAEVSGGKNAGK